jgi:glucokinase
LNLNLVGIGLGAPELVDLNGRITSAHAIAWQDIPVQEILAHLAPAVVESDVRAAALGEAHFGAGWPFKLFVYVTVGTGISCCLVQDGQPYAGARGNALILASSPLTTICHVCGTILSPVLEEFASGPALVARYNQQTSASLERGKDVLAAVEAGDETAVEIVKTAGEALGVSVGWLVNVLDPEAVIVGGGLGSARGLYWDSFISSTRRHIWSETNRDLPLLAAALGPESGVVGAAAAVLQKKVGI